MGRKKLPNDFGIINQRVWDKLPTEHKVILNKYNYHRRQLKEVDDEIDDLMVIIEELKVKKDKHLRKSEEHWKEIEHLHSDYMMTFNISKNNKYTSIKSIVNREGKSKSQLMEERKFISKNWIINVKHKGTNKPIHCGKDEKIKQLLVEKIEDITLKDIVNKDIEVEEDNIRNYISYLVRENLEDILIDCINKGENFLNKKISFNDLIN